MKGLKSKLVTFVGLTCISLSTMAADKAFIIGVGEYADPSANLPGIDLDVNLFTQTVKQFGVLDSNIRVLMDSEATKTNVMRELPRFLSDVGTNDNVFIYFSGHGSQIEDKNGDEADGLDEFLVMHDVNGSDLRQGRLTGALTDDELGLLLKAIPSERVYMFVDACHSGTVTKGLNLIHMQNRSLGETTTVEKFWSYKGMAQAKNASRSVAIEATASDNYIALTATQDDEYAIATNKGSIFTLGVNQIVQNALDQNNGITPNELIRLATQFVHANTSSDTRFTPSINGSSALARSTIETQRTGSTGEYWQHMTVLADNYGNLDIRADKSTYQLSETIRFSFNVPIDGYLNIINVDVNDHATVVFPNSINTNNRVQAGTTFSSDPNSLGFRFYGAEPLGQSLTVAVITKEPLNLYQETATGRDQNGNVTATLASFSAAAAKAVRIEATNPGTYSGAVITTVVN